MTSHDWKTGHESKIPIKVLKFIMENAKGIPLRSAVPNIDGIFPKLNFSHDTFYELIIMQTCKHIFTHTFLEYSKNQNSF